MGVYNPDAPILLGEQWVGIRDENTLFIPSVNVVEVGHGFTTTAARTLTEARFYINDWPPGQAAGQSFIANLYPKGREAQTGPIQRVVIPVNTAAVTGSTAINGNAVSAVSDPSDQSYIAFNGVSTLERYAAFFPMSLYSQLLMGKRIVGVNLLYSMYGIGGATSTHQVTLNLDSGSVVNYLPMTGPLTNQELTQISKIGLGELNPLVGTATAIAEDRYPYRYQELSRWEASAGVGRLSVMVRNTSTIGNSFNLNYLALEILFCEEQRLAYAGRNFGNVGILSPLPVDSYRLGSNFMLWRDSAAQALNPVIPVGDYTITLSSADTGDLVVGLPDAEGNFTLVAKDSQYPPLNAVRQYYAIAPHPGVQVNTTVTPGETFTKEETMVLPQVTAHTSTGPLPEMHVYGRQSIAQVYGTITATQEILDSAAGAAFSYPWVRYYARRFGDTTVPLRLDSASPTVSGSGMGVFLSPAEWDALPEIIDGWKQITLRFPTPPSMGTGMTPTWRWSALGERSGSRWEVLGVTAPAISGMNSIGNAITNSGGNDSLASATYGAPSSGSTVNEGWVPQYAPPVSATTDDNTSDAVLIFSQDMPAVSGFTVSVTSQPVSGIGLDCGLNPCGIPTAIYYNNLTWTAATDTAFDQFNRTSASGWGTTTSGTAWNNQGQPNADHTVSGGVGKHNITSIGNAVRDVLGSVLNTEAKIDISIPTVPTTANADYILVDTFTRTVANGWGSADTGQAYTIVPSSGLAANFSVTTSPFGHGRIQPSVISDEQYALISMLGANRDMVSDVFISATPASGTLNMGLTGRYVDVNNEYHTEIQVAVGGAITLRIMKRVGGVATQLSSVATGITLIADTKYTLRFQVIGTELKSKLWTSGTPEPGTWTSEVSDATLTTGDFAGVFVRNNSAATTHIFKWDDLRINNSPTPVSVITTALILRNVDSANHFLVNLAWYPNQRVSIWITAKVAGVVTTLTEVFVGSYTVNQFWTLKARIIGNAIYAKAWPRDTSVEPSFWQATGVSNAFTAAGGVGVASDGTFSVTNLPIVASYDNFLMVPVAPSWFYEIQRMDTVETGWQTIMLGNPAVSGFRDYEARVGVLSSYRIREINSYGFYGSWSSTVTATVTDPGVVGDCLSAAHILIFTTNSRQDGSSNLGYSSVWEDGHVEEGFTFPEAGWGQLQAMYGKNFFTAFRPLERGGERFQRDVLVQAAAIAPETLADFVDLRDMAWDTVPYICVRDEDGNRWYANVSVAGAKVTLYRSIYIATVDIVEITSTPTAVSP
jgi:hypothetical protein